MLLFVNLYVCQTHLLCTFFFFCFFFFFFCFFAFFFFFLTLQTKNVPEKLSTLKKCVKNKTTSKNATYFRKKKQDFFSFQSSSIFCTTQNFHFVSINFIYDTENATARNVQALTLKNTVVCEVI